MKRYTVAFAPRAERQLDELYSYIADASGTARAEDFVGGLVADCLSLSTFPERGTKRDDIRPNMRVKAIGGASQSLSRSTPRPLWSRSTACSMAAWILSDCSATRQATNDRVVFGLPRDAWFAA